MDKNERIIKIGMALGSGGRTFTSEDIIKVNNFIENAEVDMAIAEMILAGTIHVRVDEKGELFFADAPDKF